MILRIARYVRPELGTNPSIECVKDALRPALARWPGSRVRLRYLPLRHRSKGVAGVHQANCPLRAIAWITAWKEARQGA
jgi:hypothetical protein